MSKTTVNDRSKDGLWYFVRVSGDVAAEATGMHTFSLFGGEAGGSTFVVSNVKVSREMFKTISESDLASTFSDIFNTQFDRHVKKRK